MEQYIKKSAVVAEIERFKKEEGWCQVGKDTADVYYARGFRFACERIINVLDTLEMKEVELEDAKKEELAQEYIDYIFKRHNINANSKEGQLIYYAFMHGMNQCLTQLRAQKGE